MISPQQKASSLPGWRGQLLIALCIISGLITGVVITRLIKPGALGNAHALPWQLRAEDRQHYMVAIALDYAQRGDAARALEQLVALGPQQDPWQELADAACALGSSGYLASTSGIRALHLVVELYRGQGRSGCAERLLPPLEPPAEKPSASPVPDARATALPSKTPLPARPQRGGFVPTRPAQRRFDLLELREFCDPARPALLEFAIVDLRGRGIPGARIRVGWPPQQENIFLSGLQPERGDAFADFVMQEAVEYSIDMAANESNDSEAVVLGRQACSGEQGASLTSYILRYVAR